MAEVIPYVNYTRRKKIAKVVDSFWKWLLFKFHTHEWEDVQRISVWNGSTPDDKHPIYYKQIQKCKNLSCALYREFRMG